MAKIRSDANQAEIVRVLRAAGASVCSLAGVGKGCPDLLIGFFGENILVEVKNPNGRGMRFTPAEREFMATWKGRTFVICDADQALELLIAAACKGKRHFRKTRFLPHKGT